ncbi:MAG: DUF4340 domain-containing protein [Candidatus Krumholzibacteriia bacterium]
MLKTRNLIILAVVLLALLGVRLVLDRDHDRSVNRAGVDTLLPEDLTAEDLGSVVVGFGDDEEALVLERHPDGWVVATAWDSRASEQRIDSLLDGLSGLGGEFRSDSPAVLADYGFTDSTTVRITGRDPQGQEVFAIEVGRKPERAVGNFVRRPGDDRVYLASRPVLANLGIHGAEPQAPQSRQFLDLQLQQLDRQEVDAIALYTPDGTVKLRKEFAEPAAVAGDAAAGDAATDGVGFAPGEPGRGVWEWRLAEPRSEPAAKTRADAVLGAVTSVRASDVADPDADLATYGLAEPERRAVVELTGGRTVTLAFGDRREAAEGATAGVYAQVEGEDTVWVVSEYVVNNIFKSRDDLVPPQS